MRKPSIECAQHEKIQDQEMTLKFFFFFVILLSHQLWGEIGARREIDVLYKQFTRNIILFVKLWDPPDYF